MDAASFIFLVGSAAFLLVVAVGWKLWHDRRQHRDATAYRRSVEEDLHRPPSLHPVIDPNVCIGSLSCIKACPEGDILGVVGGAARLIEGANCIGHGRCNLECPVDAIKLVVGDSQRGVDLPEVDENFESSRPGVFVVGELGGMGLIRNAMAQGIEAGGYLGTVLDGGAPEDGRVDVLVVGAGPAGIAAAAACRQAGLTIRVVDQSSIGGSVAHYPRQKVVMTDRVDVPGYGRFGKRRMSKEELLEGLTSVVGHFRIEIEDGIRVDGIQGEDGAFTVLAGEERMEARKVILAVGRRGSPRRLGVPGEDSEKVTYRLIDPEQYQGRRVLVVGGGDSAIEAAAMLAEETDAEVSISYRRSAFGRCRAANRERIGRLIEQGRVRALMGTEVRRIEAGSVTLDGEESEISLDNDFVIVCAGGELPVAFLEKVQVGLERHHGDRSFAAPAARPWRKDGRSFRPTKEMEDARTRRLNLLLVALGAVIVVALTLNGFGYYVLSRAERLRSPAHEALRSAGAIGHGIGVIAALVMLSNFLYPMRKRLKLFKGTAPINRWLSFHVFVGIMSPLVIAFHAAFQSNNTLASATYVSLLVVVATGLTGRFVYGLIPHHHGETMELSEVRGQLARLTSDLSPAIARTSNPARIQAAIERYTRPKGEGRPLHQLFLHMFAFFLAPRLRVFSLRNLFASRDDYRAFKSLVLSMERIKIQIEFYSALRRFLAWWRIFHVTLAVFLVLIMGAHIGISMYLGYGWIFS